MVVVVVRVFLRLDSIYLVGRYHTWYLVGGGERIRIGLRFCTGWSGKWGFYVYGPPLGVAVFSFCELRFPPPPLAGVLQ